MPWTNMGTPRLFASSLQINPKQALIIGGLTPPSGKFLKTTELISSNVSIVGNNFPVSIIGHCSFTINATHGMVTAGLVGNQDGGGYSASTWFVDLTTTIFTPGPTMKTGRNGHGCSIFRHGTKTFGIVSGGHNTEKSPTTAQPLDSTEMINLDQESPKWTEGMQDKSKIDNLYLTKVFFLLIFRSKITQKLARIDFDKDQSRHLCHRWKG